jgi:hypothetical protein
MYRFVLKSVCNISFTAVSTTNTVGIIKLDRYTCHSSRYENIVDILNELTTESAVTNILDLRKEIDLPR